MCKKIKSIIACELTLNAEIDLLHKSCAWGLIQKAPCNVWHTFGQNVLLFSHNHFCNCDVFLLNGTRENYWARFYYM